MLPGSISDMKAKCEVTEPPLMSGVPVLGPLIVYCLGVLNQKITRWYVEPMVRQQNAVNRMLLEAMDEITVTLRAVEASAIDSERLTVQLHRRAEVLEGRLERLEQRLEAIEEALQQPTCQRPRDV